MTILPFAFLYLLSPAGGTNDAKRSLKVKSLQAAVLLVEDGTMELYHPWSPAKNKVLQAKTIYSRSSVQMAKITDETAIIFGGHDLYISDKSEIVNLTSINVIEHQQSVSYTTDSAMSSFEGYPVTCGGTKNEDANKECNRYIDGRWEGRTSMNQGRTLFSMVECSGSLFAIAGYDSKEGQGFLSSVEAYTETTGWRRVTDIPEPIKDHAAVCLGNHVYLCGGTPSYETPRSACYKYDASGDTNAWIPIASMNKGRIFFALVVFDGYLLAMGGLSPGDQSVEMYDPDEDTWTILDTKLISVKQPVAGVVILSPEDRFCSALLENIEGSIDACKITGEIADRYYNLCIYYIAPSCDAGQGCKLENESVCAVAKAFGEYYNDLKPKGCKSADWKKIRLYDYHYDCHKKGCLRYQHWNSTASGCENTCLEPHADRSCKSAPVPKCQCDSNSLGHWVKREGSCIKVEEC